MDSELVQFHQHHHHQRLLLLRKEILSCKLKASQIVTYEVAGIKILLEQGMQLVRSHAHHLAIKFGDSKSPPLLFCMCEKISYRRQSWSPLELHAVLCQFLCSPRCMVCGVSFSSLSTEFRLPAKFLHLSVGIMHYCNFQKWASTFETMELMRRQEESRR